ncbi:MAG: hypothetical protein ACLFUP_05410, partial [Desulfobacteraceae bacterium]
ARGVYEKLLAEYTELPPHTRERIQEKIQRIEDDLAEEEAMESINLTPEQEALLIQGGAEAGKEPQVVMEKASALLQAGETARALEEYGRLFKLGVPLERFISGVTACLLEIFPPEEIRSSADSLAADHDLGRQDKAKLHFKLGSRLEDKGLAKAALELYRSARATVPEDLKMRPALDEKIAGLSKDGPYAYLLNQGWISSSDLEKAKKEAADKGKSIEQTLIEAYNLKKEDVAKSLSVYFELPVKTYDPNLMPPLDLISKLNPSDLRAEGWVPLASYEHEVEILVSNPRDQAGQDRVRSLVGAQAVRAAVGIREDIEAYITRFFKDVEDSPALKQGFSPGAAPDATQARETRRERRFVPAIPDFVYVEFDHQGSDGKPRSYRLQVLNCSEHGIGLLVRKEDFGLLDAVGPGTTISNMVFYATWTLIKAGATVRHLTRIKEGRHKGCYVMGVESQEIIESSKVPD